MKIWDAETGREIIMLSDLPDRSTALAFSLDNHFLAVGTDQAARIYDLAQWRVAITIPVPQG